MDPIQCCAQDCTQWQRAAERVGSQPGHRLPCPPSPTAPSTCPRELLALSDLTLPPAVPAPWSTLSGTSS